MGGIILKKGPDGRYHINERTGRKEKKSINEPDGVYKRKRNMKEQVRKGKKSVKETGRKGRYHVYEQD